MGLFGDKHMKHLDSQLRAGWMAMALSAFNMSGEEKAQQIAGQIHAAAGALVARGRRDEAVARVTAARRPEDGEDLLPAAWNEILDAVIEQL